MAQQPSAYQQSDEERRAIEWRQQQARRRANEAARLALLEGDPLALYNCQLRFRPLTNEGTPIDREASGLFLKVNHEQR